VTSDPIVAVAFLTQNDVSLLGTGFRRMFPVTHEDDFADILRKLDRVAAVPGAAAKRP
jgi:hypothetical protein